MSGEGVGPGIGGEVGTGSDSVVSSCPDEDLDNLMGVGESWGFSRGYRKNESRVRAH